MYTSKPRRAGIYYTYCTSHCTHIITRSLPVINSNNNAVISFCFGPITRRYVGGGRWCLWDRRVRHRIPPVSRTRCKCRRIRRQVEVSGSGACDTVTGDGRNRGKPQKSYCLGFCPGKPLDLWFWTNKWKFEYFLWCSTNYYYKIICNNYNHTTFFLLFYCTFTNIDSVQFGLDWVKWLTYFTKLWLVETLIKIMHRFCYKTPRNFISVSEGITGFSWKKNTHVLKKMPTVPNRRVTWDGIVWRAQDKIRETRDWRSYRNVRSAIVLCCFIYAQYIVCLI